jgi:hypothetical protein
MAVDESFGHCCLAVIHSSLVMTGGRSTYKSFLHEWPQMVRNGTEFFSFGIFRLAT